MVYEPLYHAREIETIKLSSGCSHISNKSLERDSHFKFKTTRCVLEKTKTKSNILRTIDAKVSLTKTPVYLQDQILTLDSRKVNSIAQNAYCSRNIYFQFNKVRRSVILRAIMERLYESASAIGCQECTTKFINMLQVAN